MPQLSSSLRRWILVALLVPAAAAALPAEKGDIFISSLWEFVERIDPVTGDAETVFTATPGEVFGDLVIDSTGRGFLHSSEFGIEELDLVAGTSTTFSTFDQSSALEIGPDDTLYALTSPSNLIYSFASDGSPQLVLDASTAPTLSGVSLTDFSVAGNGDLVLLGSDSQVYSYTPGDGDVSLAASGGLLLTRPDDPAAWTPDKIDVGSDGTIYVGTWRHESSLGADYMRGVALDPGDFSQSEAAGGGVMGWGDVGSWRMAVDLDGNLLIAFNESNQQPNLGRIDADALSPHGPFERGESLYSGPGFDTLIQGIAVYPVPEPSRSAMIAAGLAALAWSRRGWGRSR